MSFSDEFSPLLTHHIEEMRRLAAFNSTLTKGEAVKLVESYFKLQSKPEGQPDYHQPAWGELFYLFLKDFGKFSSFKLSWLPSKNKFLISKLFSSITSPFRDSSHPLLEALTQLLASNSIFPRPKVSIATSKHNLTIEVEKFAAQVSSSLSHSSFHFLKNILISSQPLAAAIDKACSTTFQYEACNADLMLKILDIVDNTLKNAKL